MSDHKPLFQDNTSYSSNNNNNNNKSSSK